MEKNRKNRVVLLGALLVLGLVLAGIGTVLGVGEVFQGINEKVVCGVIVVGNQVTLYEDGKAIDNFTLPEGEEYTWENVDYAIHVGPVTAEEKRQAEESEAEMNRSLEIAKRDSRVQELIEGKEYDVISAGTSFTGGMAERIIDISVLTLEVEGKYYVVTVDMNSETVMSVEEQQSPSGFVSIGAGDKREPTWSEEEPEVGGGGVLVVGNQVTLYEDGKAIDNFTLPEGEEYTWENVDYAIHVGPVTAEEKRQAEESEAEMNRSLEIAKRDSRVQELIEGKEYDVISAGTSFTGGMAERIIDISVLTLEVEGKYYVVTVDMNSETVMSVEEQQSPSGFVSIGAGDKREPTWSEEEPEGVHRPPIQKP